jgi:hypothetical protein
MMLLRRMARVAWAALLVALVGLAQPALAQSLKEPGDPHPRLFAEPGVQEALAELARSTGSFVQRTVERCREIGRQPHRFATDGYMGLDWAQYLQSCLIAYRATGSEEHGRTALVYYRALIDDLKTVGDGAGGDEAARRDSGYSIRALGPNAALAYDWLHDFPGVDDALRARARQRFEAWTDWYLEHGYRARSPGTNYHAGYLFAATLIAVAQGGEAGADGAALWRHVVDTIFATDTLPAMRGDGVLVGGDWGEGWQYAPLSVAEYSLAGRALQRYGLDVADLRAWLGSIVTRHVYAQIPGTQPRTFALGDTQSEDAHIGVRPDTLTAVIAGPASPEAQRWAEAEMRRLNLYARDADFPLFRSLAEAARVEPAEIPRADWPRHYYAAGTGTLYARFDWSEQGVWFAAMCSRTRDVDHMHPNAGNFVLNRGADDVIVDPSPYGTLSSLTSNAPTVKSKVLPAEYQPSQAFWSRQTGFRWLRQLAGAGILLARCDYADQYRIQDTPSDVPFAQRDFVVIPANGGTDAAVLVVDRAQTPGAGEGLYLRFRTLAELERRGDAESEGDLYGGSIGGTQVQLQRLFSSAFAAEGAPELRRLKAGTCFEDGYTRGGCDASRLALNEYRAQLAGPKAETMHVISAAGRAAAQVAVREQGALRVVSVEFPGQNTIVVVGSTGNGAVTVPARASTVVLLDDLAGRGAEVTATAEGCSVRLVGAAPAPAAGPWVASLAADCTWSPSAG